MEMFEIIQLIHDMDKKIMFSVNCFGSNDITRSVNQIFWQKDDVISFLFDKDLFGWQVREWNIVDSFAHVSSMTINLYRNN